MTDVWVMRAKSALWLNSLFVGGSRFFFLIYTNLLVCTNQLLWRCVLWIDRPVRSPGCDLTTTPSSPVPYVRRSLYRTTHGRGSSPPACPFGYRQKTGTAAFLSRVGADAGCPHPTDQLSHAEADRGRAGRSDQRAPRPRDR